MNRSQVAGPEAAHRSLRRTAVGSGEKSAMHRELAERHWSNQNQRSAILSSREVEEKVGLQGRARREPRRRARPLASNLRHSPAPCSPPSPAPA